MFTPMPTETCSRRERRKYGEQLQQPRTLRETQALEGPGLICVILLKRSMKRCFVKWLSNNQVVRDESPFVL